MTNLMWNCEGRARSSAPGGADQSRKPIHLQSKDGRLGLAAGLKTGDRPDYLFAAEKHLQEHVSEPVSVTELARAAGVSPRTVHYGFRKHRGASPMKLLRQQRMQMARRELSQPAQNTSVTDIAMKWGFSHLGRFSSYYLAYFGEKPSETLRNAREKGRPSQPVTLTARAS